VKSATNSPIPDADRASPGAGTDQTTDDAPHAVTVDARPVAADLLATVTREAGKPAGDAAPADLRATVTLPAGRQAPMPDAVAGYEILGVLGRGGMGVVYKARQRGLNRLAALKMILAGGHASEEELIRFRTEAEAVARIQHPNIVQIYEIGDEGGLPYFSLEFVDGGSLADQIKGVPQAPRKAAQLVHILAGAVDCAHRAGVIHRDLKPANILMTHDGAPKITDFGLAKRLEGQVGQTHNGSILGTPGYMSPEQAEGRNEDVGRLADVYSLGVILYELLTGRIPFRGPTVLETLELIRTCEPVAPSELQPAIPRDLETICLKCLQKDRRNRYENAGALAEDLRRFVNHEPILARPVSGVERAWRWCRRNPRLAIMGAAMALVVIAWAVSMSVLAWGLKVQTDATSAALADARAKQELADANAAVAQANEEKADRNAAVAKANEDKAGRGATVAVRRMTETVGQVQQKLNGRFFSPEAAPELRALRDEVMDQLRKGMMGMAKDLEGAGATSFGEAATYQLVGDRLKRLGHSEEALKQFRLGRDAAEKIVRARPDSDKAKANLGVMLMRLGEMERELNADPRAALDYYEKGRALRQDVIDHPRSGDYSALDDKINLSHYEIGLGKTELDRGDAAAARDHFDKAVALRKAWSEALPKLDEGRSYLTEADMWRGTASAYLGDAKNARESFDEAVRLSRELVRKFPDAYWYKADLADVLGRLGDAEVRLGKDADAATAYRESLEDLRPAVKRGPDQTDYQWQLARANERLAGVAERGSDKDAARKAYQDALRVYTDLLAIEPNNLTWQAAHVRTLAHCGKEVEAAREVEKLLGRRPKSIPLLMDAARCYAACASAAAAKEPYVGRATTALRGAVAEGYKDAAALKSDPELAPIREDKAYQSLLEELAKR
jgi:tetratricopeptide (TPR) repeat protein/tRNA A-37 threonylcarbamoyl transferase component Bud32